VKIPWKKLLGKALRWLGREVADEVMKEAAKRAEGAKRP
jgi:hypothetical protein